MGRAWWLLGLAWVGCVEEAPPPEDRPPELTSVVLTPRAPSTWDTLTVQAEASDPDGDDVRLLYRWEVEAQVVREGPDPELTVPLTPGQWVEVVVVAESNGLRSAPLRAGPVFVQNASPEPGRVRMTPTSPRAWLDALRCEEEAPPSDPDGDVLTTTLHWTRNGQPWTGPTVTIATAGDGIAAEHLQRGDLWTCEREVTDGRDVATTDLVVARVAWGRQADLGSVVTGGRFNCRLDLQGRAECWGLDGVDRVSQSPSTDWLALALGMDHACGLDAELEIGCWGANDRGQTQAPGGLFRDVAAGDGFTVAVRLDGSLAVWGDTGGGRGNVPAGEWEQVVAGPRDACALDGAGGITCWGASDASDDALQGPFVDVALGDAHGCGLDAQGVLHCWGRNIGGQATPPPGPVWVDVGARAGQTCALSDLGIIRCFGDGELQLDVQAVQFDAHLGTQVCWRDADGEVGCAGAPPTYERSGSWTEDVAPSGGWSALDVGDGMTCTLGAGGLPRCLGPGAEEGLPTEPVRDLETGPGLACAVRASDGLPVCWGPEADTVGEVQFAVTGLSVGLRQACGFREGEAVCWGEGFVEPAPGPWVRVEAGWRSACGMRPEGDVECWGELGDEAAPGGVFVDLALTDGAACALRDSGRVVCWGTGVVPSGRQGDHVSIDVGEGWACARMGTGGVDCWGTNPLGEVSPPPVADLDVFAMGRHHACALDSAGALHCWGRIRRGPLSP